MAGLHTCILYSLCICLSRNVSILLLKVSVLLVSKCMMCSKIFYYKVSLPDILVRKRESFGQAVFITENLGNVKLFFGE